MKLFLYTARSRCPLTFKERLVYSVVIYRNRYNKPATQTKIVALTGLRRQTVKECIKTLLYYNLIDELRGKLIANKPEGERREWFSWRKQEGGWTKGLNYMVLRLKESNLPLSVNAVYWLLRSLKKKAKTSRGKIGRMLGLSRAQASKAVKRLEREGLLGVEECGRKGFTFTFPSESAPKPKPAPPTKPKQDKVLEVPADPRSILLAAGFEEVVEREFLCDCSVKEPLCWKHLGTPWQSRVCKDLKPVVQEISRHLLHFPTERIEGQTMDYYCYICKRQVRDCYRCVEVVWSEARQAKYLYIEQGDGRKETILTQPTVRAKL